MKKIILFLFCLVLSIQMAHAADKIHVRALSPFNSITPPETFKVEVINDGVIDDIDFIKGDIINCTLEKVTDPKRAKRNAKIYLNVVSYEDNKGKHDFLTPLRAKYAKSVVNKEEIKKIPPKKIVKKTASTVGSFFVKGFSYGVSFVDGFSENKEDNRLKSGAKQVYDDSFLSYIEYGSEVEIKEGDEFYLVISKKKD